MCLIKDLQRIDLELNKCMSIFHPLEVVGCGSKSQLQLVKILNK